MPQLILASQSPRRASLLTEAGFVIEQVSPPFDDPPQPIAIERFDPQTLATELASKKAMSLADNLPDGLPLSMVTTDDLILIAADTICVGTDGKELIGQPRDADHARTMIQSFTNETHDVVTGVALLHGSIDSDGFHIQQLMRFTDVVPVTFGDLDPGALDAYLATNQWQGKAGGYNLVDRQADGWPITLPPDADPTTVVGLPMRKLTDMLKAWGVEPN